ncbi:hypothetical protein BESB_062470 [Besnoitia besnoiti]|uniref:Translation initiation factor 3 C-terminal domain-containing protein n=1 Tax=Besnoitia besnoiti TaxID=94643 RepID=A0A2A9MIZ4_BESBE|nr:hypothetical protein BESB_062470 [Besnoitia besnoiti]PFH35360.1 hypothetical protein BESB_062470 [Besnoitia besnoiti]
MVYRLGRDGVATANPSTLALRPSVTEGQSCREQTEVSLLTTCQLPFSLILPHVFEGSGAIQAQLSSAFRTDEEAERQKAQVPCKGRARGRGRARLGRKRSPLWRCFLLARLCLLMVAHVAAAGHGNAVSWSGDGPATFRGPLATRRLSPLPLPVDSRCRLPFPASHAVPPGARGARHKLPTAAAGVQVSKALREGRLSLCDVGKSGELGSWSPREGIAVPLQTESSKSRERRARDDRGAPVPFAGRCVLSRPSSFLLWAFLGFRGPRGGSAHLCVWALRRWTASTSASGFRGRRDPAKSAFTVSVGHCRPGTLPANAASRRLTWQTGASSLCSLAAAPGNAQHPQPVRSYSTKGREGLTMRSESRSESPGPARGAAKRGADDDESADAAEAAECDSDGDAWLADSDVENFGEQTNADDPSGDEKRAYRRMKAKREQKAKKQLRKEIRLSPRIADHDLQVKANRARQFLAEKNQVVFTIQLRGRERSNPELYRPLLDRIAVMLSDIAAPANAVKQQPNALIQLFQPRKKKGASNPAALPPAVT